MEVQVFDRFRRQLLAKRQTLTAWLQSEPPQRKQVRLGTAPEQAVQAHVETLDAAITKATNHTLGQCQVCHEPVEPALLDMDYTTCVCLDHFSADERRQLEAELELAQQVQRALLPQEVPNLPGLDVAAFSRPAQIVGGDYFDFVTFGNGQPGLVIGDVAGHGVAASLLMASVQTALRTLAPSDTSPAAVLHELNRLFCHNIHFTTFVSLFVGSVDRATRTQTYANAGHNPPLLCRAEGSGTARFEWLRLTGAAIGLVEEMRYTEVQLPLAPGDVLVLYTDGVTEAADASGDFFGTEQLATVVCDASPGSAGDVLHAIRHGIEAFVEGEVLADDTTLVVAKVVPDAIG